MNVEDLYRLLRTSHVQAQSIVDTVADPMLVLDESLRVQSASRAFFEVFQVDRYETVGQLLYELGNGQWDIPELLRLLRDVIPRSSAVINYEVEHDFPELGRRVMLLSARTLFHPDKTSHTLLLSIVDATEEYRRRNEAALLLGETQHRLKNLFAVMRVLAAQSPTEGRSAEDYRDAFMGRVGALVEAQALAFAEPDDASLAALIERIVLPYRTVAEAVSIEPGAAIELRPHVVQALSLVLHELATNAAKYGALSVAGGEVRIGWQVQAEERRVRLSWLERGGPEVSPCPPPDTGPP